jgi:hypothetical protein
MFVAGGALGLSDRFFALVAAMGQRRRTDPEFYLVVWCLESGLNPAIVNSIGARGLNQMLPSTLVGLGAPVDFEQLAAEDQLPWIERLIASGEQLNGGPFRSAARYYHSNFFPATMARGDAPSTVVVTRDSLEPRERAAYEGNKGLDANGDGRITLGDLATMLDRVRATRCQDAFARLDRAVAALPSPGPTWGDAPPVARRAGSAPLVFGVGLALGTVGLVRWRGR